MRDTLLALPKASILDLFRTLNGDGSVDGQDLSVLLAAWN
jgi:hypothetical protein